jgi:hypothetical protein
LDPRRDEKDDERNGYRPDAVPAGLQGLIERVLGVVRVRTDEPNESTEKTAVTVVVTVTVPFSVPVGVGVGVEEFRPIVLGSHLPSFIPTSSTCTLRIGRTCDDLGSRCPRTILATGPEES